MLLSVILTLTPTAPTLLEGFYGRQVQAWLLSQITRHDPSFASAIHDGSKPRPYTVSSLIFAEEERHMIGGKRSLNPGDHCAIRITSLAEPLTELLVCKVLPALNGTARLNKSLFRVEGVVQDSPWCRQESYADILRDSQTVGGVSARLTFASPTAFLAGNIDQAFPTPPLVWQSLYRRWNTFCPQEMMIDPVWDTFVAYGMAVRDFKVQSAKIEFMQGKKGAVTGCVGRATYVLLRPDQCGEYASLREGAEGVLQTLAAFTLYSGIGHHTTIGLGQARSER